MREDAAAVRLADYRPPAYAIDTVDLRFDLYPEDTLVQARLRVRRTSTSPEPLKLDGERLRLVRLALNGVPLAPDAYAFDAESLTLFEPPEDFTLEIDTRINPAGATALEGLYMSGGRFCTQCEAEGFRKITYFLDRPDCLARYTVRLEADKRAFPTLLSNGDLLEAGDLPGGRHFALWRDPHVKPCYLFALVAGDFDTIEDAFLTRSARRVKLAVHVDKGEADRAWYAMDALKRAMAWDEDVFQREYDLDVFNIVAVRDFNFGAMENKGLNIFNSSYVLAEAETATDADFEAIESIVGHEYFHNWTGNRITCRDWFQLSLKEGLTVFRDQEFSADQRSRPVQRIKDVKRLRARQFPEDAGPLSHPVRPASYQKIDNFYTATVYEKGAELIRMLKALIGAEAFEAGLQLYFDRHDGQACTIEQFLACFAERARVDLDHFARWYSQAGTPTLAASGAYDAPAKRYTLHLSQSLPQRPSGQPPSPLPIPLRIGLISASGTPLSARLGDGETPGEEHCVVLDQSELSLCFHEVEHRPIPAVLRGFTAPVILRDGLTLEDRLVQMAHEPDAFTRWEAGQAMARELILSRAAGSVTPMAEHGFVEALARELARAEHDPAFAALALRTPDLPELVQAIQCPDPETLFSARESVRALIGEALGERLRAWVDRPEAEPFTPDAASAGIRAMKATALDLLAAAPGGAAIIESAFKTATSMTATMAALEALAACRSGEAAFEAALETFYLRWRAKPLVIDKWFSVQAAAPHDGGARAAALRRHPDFTLTNPNRVRALAGAFATRNVRAFHAADGSGYQFLAELIAQIDPLNPALAARLAAAFETWRRFESSRKIKAQAALEGLSNLPGVSRNLQEVVSRALSA